MMEESSVKKGGIVVAKSSPLDHHGGKDERRQAKITIKSADMKEEMQKEAVDRALAAFEKHTVEKDVAAHIKKEFDKMYGPTWHCIVGRNFGSYVTHETNHFVYFYVDQKGVLLFKSG